MPFEIRPVGPDEIPAMLAADKMGFGAPPADPESSGSWTSGELDRTRVAFDAGRIVGVSRTYSFELTMPGGALVPAAAVSWVSVLPTHRRRGVLTQMMAAMHDDARDRGEPIAMLTASESSIYARYGYGIATWRLGLYAERARLQFRDDEPAGSMRLVDRAEADTVLPAIYDAARRSRSGMVSRPDFWWPQPFWEHLSGGGKKAFFVAVHTSAAGVDDGFVAYQLDGEWNGGIPNGALLVWDMQAANPDVRRALWRYIVGVDLVGTIKATNVAIDDPLRHMVTDPRRVRVDFLNDGLWIAALDPVAALAARTYAAPGCVVVAVHAPDGKTTTVQVEGDGDVHATDAAADIECTTSMLGMTLLGGTRWTELADAGRLTVNRPDALAIADAMFATAPPPAMLSYF